MNDTLRIVLLGKTGCGKSSLANTILGRDAFQTRHFTSSEVTHCQAESELVHDRSLTVVDTPGFFHSGLSEKQLRAEIVRSASECPPGPHAFIIVLKVEKFTEQENQVIRKIQEYFSADVLKYSVIVFTHGDQLGEERKIEEFVRKNLDLKTLVDKCGWRCHVVDNKYWKNNQHETRNNRFQVARLLSTIEKMVTENSGGCYTITMLKNGQNKTQKLLVYRWFQSLLKHARGKSLYIFGATLFLGVFFIWRRWGEHFKGII